MKRFAIAVALFATSFAANASIDVAKAQGIANKNACMGCHSVDKKIVGPSYNEIAARYKGQKDAVTKLAAKIKTGGSGAWGPVPMPANPAISEADAKLVTEWILAGAPAK